MRDDPRLPPGWIRTTLGDVAQVRTGLALGRRATTDAIELPYLRVANVQDGFLDLQQIKKVTIARSEVGRYSLADGDLLLTEGGDFDKLGRGCVWRGEIPNCLHQNHVFAVRADPARAVPDYLACATSSRMGRQYFLGCAKKSTNLASINSSQIRAMPLLLPPLDEQTAICKRISAWDRSVVTLKGQLEAAVKMKTGLQNSLMSGCLRHRAHRTSQRSLKRFGDVLTESREPGTNGASAKKITVRLYGRGVVAKSDVRPGSESTQYYRRKSGQLIYSKLDFLNGAFGLIPPELEGFESTLDLPAFDISQSVDPRWLFYYVSRPGFYLGQLGLAHGGRKARRVSPKDFLEVQLCLPERDEQSTIADILRVADRQTSLIQEQIALLLKQRQGVLDTLVHCGIHGSKEEAA